MVIHSLMGFPRSFGPPQSIQSLPASARLLQLGLRHAIATCRCTWPRQHRKLRLQSTQRGGLWAVFLTWHRRGKRWETSKSLYEFSLNCGNIMEHPLWILGHVRNFFAGSVLILVVLWGFLGNSWTSKFLSGPVMAVPVEDCPGDSRTLTPRTILPTLKCNHTTENQTYILELQMNDFTIKTQ